MKQDWWRWTSKLRRSEYRGARLGPSLTPVIRVPVWRPAPLAGFYDHHGSPAASVKECLNTFRKSSKAFMATARDGGANLPNVSWPRCGTNLNWPSSGKKVIVVAYRPSDPSRCQKSNRGAKETEVHRASLGSPCNNLIFSPPNAARVAATCWPFPKKARVGQARGSSELIPYIRSQICGTTPHSNPQT